MARFARDCRSRMNELTKRLEVDLGPDTGDLKLRIGMHSGPVTAGVLRGEKSRFQLFGDSMNTASRIETTGEADRIHVSSDMAERLRDAGKEHWLRERETKVEAKGKGVIQTFWLEPRAPSGSSVNSSESDTPSSVEFEVSMSTEVDDSMAQTLKSSKEARLVSWVSDTLLRLLRELTCRREALDLHNPNRRPPDTEAKLAELEQGGSHIGSETMVLDEVQEIIELPNFNAIADKYQKDPESVALPQQTISQVHHYVRTSK